MANILPYEVSLWEDYHSGDGLTERRIGIIGSSEYKAPVHIFEPTLVTKVNGTTEFEFKICYKYRDEQTGALVDNPWCDYLVNERKIKVKYDNKWYDLVLKDVTKQTKEYIYTCRASDAHVQELARNGFNLEFAPELENNYNDIQNLGNAILSGTGWEVSKEKSDNIYQYENEVLYGVTKNMPADFTWTEIVKNTDGSFSEQSHISSMPTENVYIFESSRNVTNGIVSFLYGVPAHIKLDQVNSQQVIKPAIVHQGYYFGNTSQAFTEPADGYKPVPLYANDSNTVIGVVRGERYVHTQQEAYEPVLNRWVRLYKDDQKTEYRSYTDTTYLTPAAVREYVANGYNFTNTSGWRAASWNTTDSQAQSAKASNVAVELIKDTSLYQTAISAGESWPTQDAEPAWIKLNVLNSPTNHYPVALVNLGVQSQIKQMGAVTEADEFLIGIVADSEIAKSNLVLEQADYNAVSNVYSRKSDACSFKISDSITISQTDFVPDGPNDPNADTKIYWFIAKPNGNYSIEQLTRKAYRWILAITPPAPTSTPAAVRAMYMFKKQTTQNGSTYVSPYNWNTVGSFMETRDYWYKSDDTSEISSIDKWVYCEAPQSPVPVYHDHCAKIRSITAKESNRFNLLQELCEQFQCWMEFNVEHDEIGRITEKKVSFHNVIGEPNYAGFRYGINEKSIKRSSDSKELVSKLIVKPNSNEFATNGFCTIARSKANPTKDTAIYNFDYYITHGLIDQSELYNSLNKYYKDLYEANTKIENYSIELIEIATALTDAEAKRQVYEAGLEAADVNITKTQDSLKEMTGYTLADFEDNWGNVLIKQNGVYVDIRTLIGQDIHVLDWDRLPDEVVKVGEDGFYINITTSEEYYNLPFILYLFSSKARQYVDELRQYVAQHDMYEQQYNAIVTHIDGDNGLKKTQEGLNELLITEQGHKEQLGFEFYQQWAPFIQEGTFIDESYRNDDQYYYAAQQAGFESAMPKASYTIEVASIGAIPEFEGYTFKLGDQTTIEDVDFFGYMPDGFTPYRESITITEVSNNLDDPSKDKITVKNFSDQFDSLFQRMAATVQQVSYSTGAYEKAAALAEADVPNKLQFLSDALNSAQNVLSNAADQTVKWDNTGITVTNGLAPNEILRMVSGAILLSDNGGVNWTTAITARGISANLITSGQINTNVLQIMNGNQPAFKWDEKGLTAYEVLGNNQIDYTAGVRFDRHGLYGFEGAQPDWAPNTVDEIHQNSNFELTKEGLVFNPLGATAANEIEIKAQTQDLFNWDSDKKAWVYHGLRFVFARQKFWVANANEQRTILKYVIPAGFTIKVTYKGNNNNSYYVATSLWELNTSNTNEQDIIVNGGWEIKADAQKAERQIIKTSAAEPCYLYVYQANSEAPNQNDFTVTAIPAQRFNYFYPNGKLDYVNNEQDRWILNINGKTGISKDGTLSAVNALISGTFNARDNNGRMIDLLRNTQYPLALSANDVIFSGINNNGSVLFNMEHLLSAAPIKWIGEVAQIYTIVINPDDSEVMTQPWSKLIVAPWPHNLGTLITKARGASLGTATLWQYGDISYQNLKDTQFIFSIEYYAPDGDQLEVSLVAKPTKSTLDQKDDGLTQKCDIYLANYDTFQALASKLTIESIPNYTAVDTYGSIKSVSSDNGGQILAGEYYAWKTESTSTLLDDTDSTKKIFGDTQTYYSLSPVKDDDNTNLPVFGGTTNSSIGGFILQPGQSFRIASTAGYYWEIKCSNEEGNVGKLSIDDRYLTELNLTSS